MLQPRFYPRGSLLPPTHSITTEMEMYSIMVTHSSVHQQRTRPSPRPQMVLLHRPSLLHHSRAPLLTPIPMLLLQHLRIAKFTKAGPALQERFSIHSSHTSRPHQHTCPLSITIIDRTASRTLLPATCSFKSFSYSSTLFTPLHHAFIVPHSWQT